MSAITTKKVARGAQRGKEGAWVEVRDGGGFCVDDGDGDVADAAGVSEAASAASAAAASDDEAWGVTPARCRCRAGGGREGLGGRPQMM